MGFKPKSYLKVYHNLKHSYFVFPDEKKVTGSSQCTDALIKEMLKAEKIAIVKFIPRENSQLRFCALVPQEEQIDSKDGYQTPAGFQLIPLPFADDLRDNKSIFEAAGIKPQEKGIIDTLTREEKNSAKLLVKNLNIEFDSRNFENPSIQKFFTGLQALALNEEQPEEFEDLMEPDYEGLKKFDKVLGKFRDTFYDGAIEDPECAEKPKAAGRGGWGGAGRGRGGWNKPNTDGRTVMNLSPTNSQTSSRGGRGRGATRGRGAAAARGRGSKATNQHLEIVQEKEEPQEPPSKKRKINE
jgi:ATP-dependent DNA helicase 2 subunit 1